jgi:hypothetical protein
MATTTPNFGWPVPTSTDLVKDGAVAIEGLGDAIDASLLDLKGGTTNQVLAKNSNTDMDFKWVADASGIPATIIDAKGDLIAGTAADTAARLAVGTNGQVLTADSTAATGLAWATAGGSSGPAFQAFRSGTQQSFSQNTWSKVQFNGETFDTDNCFDSTTNYRFTPNKAGYYQFNSTIGISRTGSYAAYGAFYKNGTEVSKIYGNTNMAGTGYNNGAACLSYMNGTTDYMEVYVYDSDPAGRNVVADVQNSNFSGIWIRS